MVLNDTPHSSTPRPMPAIPETPPEPAPEAPKLSAAQKVTAKCEAVADELRSGKVLLMKNSRHWTYEPGGARASPATVKHMIRLGMIVERGDGLFPEVERRSQTWELAK